MNELSTAQEIAGIIAITVTIGFFLLWGWSLSDDEDEYGDIESEDKNPK